MALINDTAFHLAAQRLVRMHAAIWHLMILQTIETLDERGGFPRHHMWPPLPPPPVADTGAAGDREPEAEQHPWELLPAPQRLADVLEYLRGQHCYCLFCGCQVIAFASTGLTLQMTHLQHDGSSYQRLQLLLAPDLVVFCAVCRRRRPG